MHAFCIELCIEEFAVTTEERDSTAHTLSALAAVDSSSGHRLPAQLASQSIVCFLSKHKTVVCFSCALRFCSEIENSEYEMKSNIPARSYRLLLRA